MEQARALVIGYGNRLRRDDALGVSIAEGLAGEHPDATVLLVPELYPELAEPVAAADVAVFVDAREGGVELGVTSEELLDGSCRVPWIGHISDPRAILALAQAVYGRRPRAFLVTAPIGDTNVGVGLSAAGTSHVPRAIRAVSALLEGARAR